MIYASRKVVQAARALLLLKAQLNRAPHWHSVRDRNTFVVQGDFVAIDSSDVIVSLMSMVVQYIDIFGKPPDPPILNCPVYFARIVRDVEAGNESLAFTLVDREGHRMGLLIPLLNPNLVADPNRSGLERVPCLVLRIRSPSPGRLLWDGVVRELPDHDSLNRYM
jgi:hypothetical protein